MGLLQKAEALLLKEYKEAFEKVKESAYYKDFVNEKYVHSIQVMGAGNGIIKNEPYFQNQTPQFIEICRVAILLHDIYRFREMVTLCLTGKKSDHGVQGAEFLKQFEEFNHLYITLPIKHHGHIIEDLYDDLEYQNLDEKTQDIVKHICFAVRDADKIANWYPLFVSDERFDFWFSEKNKLNSEKITDAVWKRFYQNKIVIRKDIKTSADDAIGTFAWLFDINYQYSIFYCKRLKIFEKMPNVLKKLNIKDDYITTLSEIIRKYLEQNF